MLSPQSEELRITLRERLREFSKRVKARHTELKELWKPIGITLSIISGLATAYKFVEDYGRLTLPVAGLLLLFACLLMTVPVRGIQLFVLRSFAFFVDFAFLSSLAFAALVLYSPNGVYPGAPILMVVVWLWFFYFVLFDWRSQTTPGKQLFRLRLRSDERQLEL